MQEAQSRFKNRTSKAAQLVCAVVLLALVAISTVSATSGTAGTATTATGPVIQTDKNSYLAGETLTISGEGFSALESVMLRVAHANGSGFEPWWVYADASGAFRATWTLPSGDVGADYAVTASGSSGSTAQAAFARKASMSVARVGSGLQISAEGFNPNEPVTVQLSDNSAPTTLISDDSGRIAVTFATPQTTSSAMTATAIATASFVTASITIPSGFFAVPDQQGPNDPGVQDQSDLTQMGRDNTDASLYKIFWSWDATDKWVSSGNTGDACALFDSDGDGNINYAVCAQIANANGNPLVVAQTSISPTSWTCSDAKNDRCTQPTARAIVVSNITQVKAGPLGNVANSSGNLITDTDPFTGVGSNYPNDSTIEMDILKTYVPNSVLVNVCSYPSAGNGGNNNPFDCIVAPGGGFLRITKDAGAGVTDPFTFTVSPIPAGQSSTYTVNGGSTSAAIGVANGSGAKGETVTETVPANWTLTGATCKLEDGTTSTGTFDSATHKVSGITIESGKTTTCTFVNSKQQGTLKVIKSVTNPYGGAVTAADFKYDVTFSDGTSKTGETGSATGNSYTRNSGVTYSVAEQNTPIKGYSTTYSSDCTSTIDSATPRTCTITNTPVQPKLTVTKVIVDNFGGGKQVSDFVLKVDSTQVTSGVQNGFNIGQHTVSEVSLAGYDGAFTGDCDSTGKVTLTLGDVKSCTITNTAVQAKLTVTKVVVDNFGGGKVVADFPLKVGTTDVTSGVQNGINAGTYTVSETSQTGYTGVISGDCAANGTITLKVGDVKSCTITNTAVQPKLTVIKIVDNKYGGSKHVSDFPLKVDSTSVTSGVQAGFNAGLYTVSETNNYPSDYVGSFSGDCAADGKITLNVGDVKTCTITNTELKGAPTGSTVQSWIIKDTVTITGLKSSSTGGTVNFRLFDGAGCLGNLKGSNDGVAVVINSGGATVSTPTGVGVASPGTYYWEVTYSGDANNGGFTLCNESTQIIATPPQQ